mmetsp:Transcript_34648/g.91814  ORF Transcript_34648/g.91814 Transcript_34648/m.91814 type:complete len:321 (-) Transcript_34648:68-1030(-)
MCGQRVPAQGDRRRHLRGHHGAQGDPPLRRPDCDEHDAAVQGAKGVEAQGEHDGGSLGAAGADPVEDGAVRHRDHPRVRPHGDLWALRDLRVEERVGQAAAGGAGPVQGPAGRPQGHAGGGRRHRPGDAQAGALGRRDHRGGCHDGQRRNEGLPQEPLGHREGLHGGRLQQRRPGRQEPRRVHPAEGQIKGHHHLGRREHLDAGGGEPAPAAPEDRRDRRRRAPGREVGGDGGRVGRAGAGRAADGGGAVQVVPRHDAALLRATNVRFREPRPCEDVHRQGAEARPAGQGQGPDEAHHFRRLCGRRSQVQALRPGGPRFS